MEGKTNFSTRLKQFDGLTWLTPTPLFYDRSTPLIVKIGQHLAKLLARVPSVLFDSQGISVLLRDCGCGCV